MFLLDLTFRKEILKNTLARTAHFIVCCHLETYRLSPFCPQINGVSSWVTKSPLIPSDIFNMNFLVAELICNNTYIMQHAEVESLASWGYSFIRRNAEDVNNSKVRPSYFSTFSILGQQKCKFSFVFRMLKICDKWHGRNLVRWGTLKRLS